MSPVVTYTRATERVPRDRMDIMSKVINSIEESIDFAAAVSIMDDELREEVAADIAPCTDQEFFDEYSRRHADKFGEGFAPYVGAAW